jgi:maltooligosyltrehalose trehalohydrolase
VYNHLGPEGNYLTAYGPYFTSKYKTPWGGAINFDDAYCEGVREFFIENALMWFRDFHVDALRLDAVHAISDFGPVHILQEIRQYTDRLTEQTGRDYYLIVELDLNDPVYIDPLQKKGYGMNAQWNDEFHHALRVTAGEKRQGYFSDFNGIEHLCKAYQDAYVYDGQYSAHRGKKFGLRSTNEGHQFVVFSQNHDQTGNRMLGERTSTLVSFEMQKLLAGAVMVSPYLPLLFMGEEWSEPNPFLYFVSHTDPELAEAVRRGRREEFAAFHLAGEAPDPMDEKTFRHSGLQWNLLPAEPYKTMHQYYKALIRLRKNNRILSAGRRQVYCACQPENETLGLLRDYEEEQVACLLNFSKKVQCLPLPKAGGPWRLLLDSAAPVWRGPAAAPQEIPATAASSSVVIRPESILVYGCQGPEEGTDYSTLTI